LDQGPEGGELELVELRCSDFQPGFRGMIWDWSS
jgi:hypothetical protein